MMLAPLKLSLSFLGLAGTFFLYNHNNRFAPSTSQYAVAPAGLLEAVTVDSQPLTQQNVLSKNLSNPATSVPETANRASNVSAEKRSRVLQATMMFGDRYLGLNERTLQSHIDHASRWGYENHILRREIVGTDHWDKFIFSKLLHVLDLVIGELKKPRDQRAEWVVWYDADTLILNPNIHWELFLPPESFPDIHFMATKNIDGFNAGLFFFRVNEWSVEILSDAYSLRRLLPEVDISGNIEQNALKYLFGQAPNRKHVLYQPQLWYNGFHGDERAQTEVNEGDMLVHFAGVNHDWEGEKKENLMSEWFAKIEQDPEKWQVPLEKTKYPSEIEEFWTTYKEAKETLNTSYVKPRYQSERYQDVKVARDELKWAIEELAFDTEYIKGCMEDVAQALRGAQNPQEVVGSSDHVNPQTSGSDAERTEPAVDGRSRFSHNQQLAAGIGVRTGTSEVT